MNRLLTVGMTCLSLIFVGTTVYAQGNSDPYEALKLDVGTWKAKAKMWVGAPEPQEFEGTEVNRMLGDFWLVSDFKGEVFGTPFFGHSTTGYNSESKKYLGSWVDSMNPNPMHTDGTYDAKTKTMTSFGSQVDPAGNTVKSKTVVVYVDANKRVMTMYNLKAGSTDEWERTMEITYERADDKGGK